jgi:hypothetical protein
VICLGALVIKLQTTRRKLTHFGHEISSQHITSEEYQLRDRLSPQHQFCNMTEFRIVGASPTINLCYISPSSLKLKFVRSGGKSAG